MASINIKIVLRQIGKRTKIIMTLYICRFVAHTGPLASFASLMTVLLSLAQVLLSYDVKRAITRSGNLIGNWELGA